MDETARVHGNRPSTYVRYRSAASSTSTRRTTLSVRSMACPNWSADRISTPRRRSAPCCPASQRSRPRRQTRTRRWISHTIAISASVATSAVDARAQQRRRGVAQALGADGGLELARVLKREGGPRHAQAAGVARRDDHQQPRAGAQLRRAFALDHGHGGIEEAAIADGLVQRGDRCAPPGTGSCRGRRRPSPR